MLAEELAAIPAFQAMRTLWAMSLKLKKTYASDTYWLNGDFLDACIERIDGYLKTHRSR